MREAYLALAGLAIRKLRKADDTAGIRETCPVSIIDMDKWEWAQGIGLFGTYRYYRATGDRETLDYLVDWYRAGLARGIADRNINTTAPFLTLAFLAEETGDPVFLAACAEWGARIMADFPRTEEGGFQHIVSGEANRGQLWDDTLFMAVLFLAKTGRMLGNDDYVQEAVRQFLVHAKYLADPATGLWFHGWKFEGRHHFAGALWARGNCWVTAGIVEFLEIIGRSNSGVERFLAGTLRAQAAALKARQDPSGLWHTLLDDPDSYLEASATAGFAYGLYRGIRMGLLDEAEYGETARRAVRELVGRIESDGTVGDVSYGTGMGLDLDYYRCIPKCRMTYGQALAALALIEAARAENGGNR